MKMSATIAIPKNSHKRNAKYTIAIRIGGSRVVPGIEMKLIVIETFLT